jgi:protein disulfide-isomerase
MKLSSLLIFLLAINLYTSTIHALVWQSDYEKVHSLSKLEKKPMLLFFNGSDWSGYAMRMKHEVLDSSSFQQKIGASFLYMEVDFPQHSSLDEATLRQNESLKARFNIVEIPTLLLIDEGERIIAQIGYLPESGEQLAEDLLKIREQDQQLMSGLLRLDQHGENLQKLYQLAQELGQQSAIEQIVEKGLQTEDPYFLLEKYRLLVEGGKMGEKAAMQLRKKIVSIEGTGSRDIHFTLALIDFQQLSQSNTSADCAVRPLLEYLDRYSRQDQSNIWRIEMMIAQLYMEGDEREKALLHAEKALQYAPTTMHDEIAHSLDYIRKAPIK